MCHAAQLDEMQTVSIRNRGSEIVLNFYLKERSAQQTSTTLLFSSGNLKLSVKLPLFVNVQNVQRFP